MLELDQHQRVDWPQILADLHSKGMTLEAIYQDTGIPASTVAGYKTLNAEPKHADGERLVGLWRRMMVTPVPLVTGTVRNTPRAPNATKSLSGSLASLRWPPKAG